VKQKPQPEQQPEQQTEQPVDDVIAVFVMAEKEQPPIKGEQILSAQLGTEPAARRYENFSPTQRN